MLLVSSVLFFFFAFFFYFFNSETYQGPVWGGGQWGGKGGSSPPASGSKTHRGGCCRRGEGSDPHPRPRRLSPCRLPPLRRRTEQNRGSRVFREREAMFCPDQGPFPPGLWGSLGAEAEGWDFPPTPEQVSFSLCTRADLPLLSTLFIPTEAAGWFSHLCVCRYIDFVLKEDGLTPAGGGVFVMPPSRPWGGRVPTELMRFRSVVQTVW